MPSNKPSNKASQHPDLPSLLGPAALGLLTSPEQARLDEHLRGCAACRAELTQLTGVVGRLADLDGESALLAELEPDPRRAEQVLAAVAAERRRSARWQSVVAAAAAVVVLAAGVVSAAALGADPSPQVPLEAVAVQAQTGVDARADLVAHTWGVEIKLAATGLADGEAYTVQVRTSRGEIVDAGAFLGTGDRTLFCNLNSSVLRPDATAFMVFDGDGTRVISADL